MEYKFKVFILNFLFFPFCFICLAKNSDNSLCVRVLLENKKEWGKDFWSIRSENGFVLVDMQDFSKKIQCNTKELSIYVLNQFFYINGKKFLKKQFKLFPKDGLLEFNGNFYKGSFLICLDTSGDVKLINFVELEDYIFAVLRSESWPGWPLEVNKVFAIVTRSYVIAKMCEANKRGRLFHIKNTKIHQTYNGHKFQKRNSSVLQQAVNETAGLFLVYDNIPILAMFDSCCGGVVPSKVGGVDFKKAPYLERDYPCKHCKRCSLYSWSVEYNIDEWTEILRKTFPELKKVRGIKVTNRDEAGLILEVVIVGLQREFAITGKKLYSLLDAVKSFCFTVHKNGKNILLKGRGYGHHLGLCQWGAREMVRNSWDYKKIINFYYPDVSLVRLV